MIKLSGLVLGAFLVVAPGLAAAQAVTQTGAVKDIGGNNLQLTPTTQFNQSCNSGAGGIVGQTYSTVVCAMPGATISGTVTVGAQANAAPQSATEGQTNVPLSIDLTRNLRVVFSNTTIGVTGTFWQATQPVSGTFWQATQPISAVSLPLPTGAATETTLANQSAKLPASLGAKTGAGSISVVPNSDTPFPTNPLQQVTSTSASSTVATHLQFQTLLASNASRKGCFVQNRSTDTEYVFVGANGSATTAASVALAPGQPFNCGNANVVATDNLAITSAVLDGAQYMDITQ